MNERITVLYPITDLARDGAQRQLLELVKGLDKKRFRPVVLTLRSEGSMEVEFKAVPELELISLGRKGKYDLLCLYKIIGIIRGMKVDVVQPFLTPATFFSLLPALVCHTPVKIVTERLSSGRTDLGFGYRLYLKIEDLLSRFADRAIANSKAGEEYLIQRGVDHNRIGVIYNGLNFERLSAGKEDIERVRRRLDVPFGGKVVGMIARLFPQKRHDVFLQASTFIDAVMPDTRFAIVGDGPLRSHLENRSQELGIASKVTFFGEQREVGPYISAFDIAVLTSEAEGCSNSVLEAMALAKPVVATDVGGNRELVSHGESGFLVPAGDAKAVAQAILYLVRNPEVARTMGQRARRRVASRFSISKMVQQYESLYEETLRAKSTRYICMAKVNEGSTLIRTGKPSMK
jgi:glycosyltransferase involved in cell wall biosynthesis